MGIYVNPISETKERWLEKHGELLIQLPNEIKSEKEGEAARKLVRLCERIWDENEHLV